MQDGQMLQRAACKKKHRTSNIDQTYEIIVREELQNYMMKNYSKSIQHMILACLFVALYIELLWSLMYK